MFDYRAHHESQPSVSVDFLGVVQRILEFELHVILFHGKRADMMTNLFTIHFRPSTPRTSFTKTLTSCLWHKYLSLDLIILYFV